MRGRNGRRRWHPLLAAHAVRAASAWRIRMGVGPVRGRAATAIPFLLGALTTAACMHCRVVVMTAAAIMTWRLTAWVGLVAAASVGIIAATASGKGRGGQRETGYNEPDRGFREHRIAQVAKHAFPGLACEDRRNTETHCRRLSAMKSGCDEFLRQESILSGGGHCSVPRLHGQGRSLMISAKFR